MEGSKSEYSLAKEIMLDNINIFNDVPWHEVHITYLNHFKVMFGNNIIHPIFTLSLDVCSIFQYLDTVHNLDSISQNENPLTVKIIQCLSVISNLTHLTDAANFLKFYVNYRKEA